MASTVNSNPITNSNRGTRKNKQVVQTTSTEESTTIQWKSESQQQIYSSRLLRALRRVRQSTAPPRSRAVREAADRALAATAKGRTRWSLAILTNRLKLKFMKNSRRQRATTATAARARRPKKPRVSVVRLKYCKNLSDVQRKARVLGRLVPGCKKEPLPVVLEEVIDYIPALEMQIRAMRELLSISGTGGSGSGSGGST